MSDPRDPNRPRPQFGEYATPEEQQAHIREPLPAPLTPPAQQHPAEPVHAPVGVTRAPARSGPDRIITLILLGLGAASLVIMAPALFSFTDSLAAMFSQLGIPEEAAHAPREQGPYTTAGLVLLAGFALTVFVSLRLQRAGRVSSWVPPVGAVVTWIVVFAIMTPALASDPGFIAYMELMTTEPTLTP